MLQLTFNPGLTLTSFRTTRPSWTAAELQWKQEADPNLRQILLWKRNRAAQPAQREVQGTSKATKSLWAQRNRLLLENSMLYRQWQTEDGRGTLLQLVLLRSLVPDTRVVRPSFCCTKYNVALRDREGQHCPERVNGKCRLSPVKSKLNISVSFLTKISHMDPFQSMPICMDQDIFTRST